jgi:hypothetical protein
VASAPEQLALLVLAHLLPTLLDDAAQRLFLAGPRDGGGDWLVGRRGEVNGCDAKARRGRARSRSGAHRARDRAAVSQNSVLYACMKGISAPIRFRGRNFEAHHLDFFVIVY